MKPLGQFQKMINLGLKWPNDIIFNSKKVGGILVEQEILGKDILSITGIGININLPHREAWWGDLSELDAELKREEIINQIILGFINFKNDNIDMKKKWESSCMHLQKKIKIIQDGNIVDEGTFIGINKDGSLLLQGIDDLKTYHFGEISILGVY